MNAEDLVDLLDDYLDARELVAEWKDDNSVLVERFHYEQDRDRRRAALAGALKSLLREDTP